MEGRGCRGRDGGCGGHGNGVLVIRERMVVGLVKGQSMTLVV